MDSLHITAWWLTSPCSDQGMQGDVLIALQPLLAMQTQQEKELLPLYQSHLRFITAAASLQMQASS